MSRLNMLLLGLVFLFSGCSSSSDAARLDGALPNNSDSSNVTTADQGAQSDAGTVDAASQDAASQDAANQDAANQDARIDAKIDAQIDSSITYTEQCAPNNSLTNTSGIGLSTTFWVGYRFELTTPRLASRIGLYVASSDSTSQTIFGAIVALTGAWDEPDQLDLSGSDVLTTALITMNPASSGAGVVSAPTSAVNLPAGWYAVIFGSGKFGATAANMATIYSQAGEKCDNNQHPFTIISQSSLGLQAASPHLFVEMH